MKLEEFKQKLANAEDKVSVLADKENINSCENMTFADLKELIDTFLTDSEKIDVIKLEHFKNNTTIKNFAIKSIKTEEGKLKALQDKEILEIYKDSSYIISNMLDSISPDNKLNVIAQNSEALSKTLGNFDLKRLIKSLDGEAVKQIVTNEKVLSNLGFAPYELPDIVCKLNEDNLKLDLAKKYEFTNSQISDVLKNVNDKLKLDILKSGEYDFSEYQAQSIIANMSAENITEVIFNDKTVLDRYGLSAHKIVSKVDDEKQLSVIQNIDKLGIEKNEQRKCLALLNEEVKSKVDRDSFDKDVIDALDVAKDENGTVILDFCSDLSKYRGLDEIIKVNPLKLQNEEKEKFKELANICPNMNVLDNLVISSSTSQEYLNAEAWIEQIEAGINNEWSDVEKIAYIDNAIGKKVSYTPDFGTEECDVGAARSLWKIIDSGYGVCNGISQVEQYMLKRVGIESEMISGKQHAFLKVPNLEVECADGTVKRGSSILDPTWNLAEQRFGAKPDNFLRSYEEIRKHDIRKDGTDVECHRNDEKLSDATLDIDDTTLRQIYANIGIVNREDMKFPITEMIDNSQKINDLKLDTKTSIQKQFELLEKMTPDFATCLCSTETMLKGVLLAGDNLEYDRMIIDRVYAKDDKGKRPVQYVYTELADSEKVFFYVDSEQNKFKEMSVKEFEEKFACYENDMKKHKR